MQKTTKKGVFALLTTSLIAKGLGVFYRIPLMWVLSAKQVGIYQLVFPLYAFLLALIGGGIPVAVTKISSKLLACGEDEKVTEVTDCALVFFGCVALLSAVLLSVFAPCVGEFLGNLATKNSVIAIAPSLLFACIIAVFRGYFQAVGKVSILGVSLLLEQAIKCVGIVLVVIYPSLGEVGVILGVTLAECITALVMLCAYLKNKKFAFKLNSSFLRPLFLCCASVSLGLIAMPLSGFIDGVEVVNLLSKSMQRSEATALYGLMSGAVAPLIAVPSVITSTLSVYLLPMLCRADKSERSAMFNQKCKPVILITAFISLSYFIFAPHIVKILYPTLSKSNYFACVKLLQTASPTVLLSSLLSLVIVFLQSANKPFIPALILLFAVGLKALALPFAVSFASIYGAQAVSVAFYCVAFVSCVVLAMTDGFCFTLKALFSFVLTVLTFAFFAYSVYILIPTLFGAVLAVIIGASVSFSLCFSLKTVKKEQVLSFRF